MEKNSKLIIIIWMKIHITYIKIYARSEESHSNDSNEEEEEEEEEEYLGFRRRHLGDHHHLGDLLDVCMQHVCTHIRCRFVDLLLFGVLCEVPPEL